MDIQNFIAEFKKTFVYDLLSMTLKDEQLFEHFVDGDKVIWFKEQTRQMWEMWQQAQKVAVPEGFVLDKPAKVGNGTFGIGVKWSTVIGAAQRQFEYAQNNTGEKTNVQDLKGILFDVPEGFVLVPKEPQQLSIGAMWDAYNTSFTMFDVYKAMIEVQEQSNA